MEVYKAGKFKGYAESFTQSEPSPENEQQYRELIDGLHASLIRFLVKEKGKSEAYWENVIANNLGALAQSAIDEQLIHAISYEKDFQEKIKSKYNYKSSNFLTLNQYKNRSTIKSKRDNVAYVVMEGGINVDGDEISSNNLKKEFKKINESDDYKAVILRVNSGGGSAFASDDIWNEVEKIKNKGIPVIASVGNVAASGGYYVLMNSDKIFANENSVLGSIGVFMLFPNLEETMETHVGVNHVKFSTSDYSPNPDIFVELSPEMRAKYQRETEFIYETFVEKVSEGRGIDIQKVKEIAEGRIYTGARAKEIGLIDDFKSLNEIKEYLKDTYDLSYISLDEYPKETNNDLPSLLSSIKVNISGGNSIDQLTSKHLKEANNIIENSLKLEPRMELLGISIK
jgi:protease-4